MTVYPDPRNNKLLAALPDAEWRNLLPQLERVELSLGRVICEPGCVMSHVYFPTTAIFSLLYVMTNGASTEISIIGHEGVVGVALFLGGESSTTRTVIQSAGEAFRLKADILKSEFNRSAPLMQIMLRFTQALMAQTAQTAACNRHHSLDQQLCRWLLLSLDRVEGNELTMTQELIANMLGVDRKVVIEGALKLQNAGLISYVNGRITVLDRADLEKRACECYGVITAEYARLIPPPRITRVAGNDHQYTDDD